MLEQRQMLFAGIPDLEPDPGWRMPEIVPQTSDTKTKRVLGWVVSNASLPEEAKAEAARDLEDEIKNNQAVRLANSHGNGGQFEVPEWAAIEADEIIDRIRQKEKAEQQKRQAARKAAAAAIFEAGMDDSKMEIDLKPIHLL
jgi:hypothetical protein